MTTEIEQAVAALEARRDKLNAAIAVLCGLREESSGFTPARPIGEETTITLGGRSYQRVKRVKGRRGNGRAAAKRATAKVEAAPRSDTRASNLRVKIREWLDNHGAGLTHFTVDDLPASLREDRLVSGKCLSNMKAKGELTKAGRGQFRVANLKGNGKAEPAKIAATPVPPGKAPPMPEGRLMKDRAAAAAAHCIKANGGKSLTGRAIILECQRIWPGFIPNESEFLMGLIDAVQAGELERVGRGPDAVYTLPPE